MGKDKELETEVSLQEELMTEDELNALTNKVVQAKEGKCEPPTKEELQRAYATIRAFRSKPRGGKKVEKTVKQVLPDSLDDLFV